MSDAAAIALSAVSLEAAATRRSLQTTFVRQQASAEQGIVALLEQSVEQTRATLPAGQGQTIDLSA